MQFIIFFYCSTAFLVIKQCDERFEIYDRSIIFSRSVFAVVSIRSVGRYFRLNPRNLLRAFMRSTSTGARTPAISDWFRGVVEYHDIAYKIIARSLNVRSLWTAMKIHDHAIHFVAIRIQLMIDISNWQLKSSHDPRRRRF